MDFTGFMGGAYCFLLLRPWREANKSRVNQRIISVTPGLLGFWLSSALSLRLPLDFTRPVELPLGSDIFF